MSGRQRRPLPEPEAAEPALAAPRNLTAHRFDVGAEAYVIFEFDLPSASELDLPETLTTAERAVARLLLEGRRNAEIAAERGKSPRTIANQVASIFRKLGVGARSELHALAARSRR